MAIQSFLSVDMPFITTPCYSYLSLTHSYIYIYINKGKPALLHGEGGNAASAVGDAWT